MISFQDRVKHNMRLVGLFIGDYYCKIQVLKASIKVFVILSRCRIVIGN
jgi:hypothetical protein